MYDGEMKKLVSMGGGINSIPTSASGCRKMLSAWDSSTTPSSKADILLTASSPDLNSMQGPSLSCTGANMNFRYRMNQRTCIKNKSLHQQRSSSCLHFWRWAPIYALSAILERRNQPRSSDYMTALSPKDAYLYITDKTICCVVDVAETAIESSHPSKPNGILSARSD
ncbi:hypothetical protein BDV97DRAFT_371136 [Delphinella strobiligena]|nr:hypothetical protein BDV97DRAFT_371136 [Delphinella strobiligena]